MKPSKRPYGIQQNHQFGVRKVGKRNQGLATKDDVTASTTELRGEINGLRRETKAMAAELRGEISSAVNKMLLAQLAIAGLLFAALWILG